MTSTPDIPDRLTSYRVCHWRDASRRLPEAETTADQEVMPQC